MDAEPGFEQIEVRLLILRSQQGDPDAFRRLVERFDRRLLYFVTSLINDPEQSLDVSQETWLSVFRQFPKLSSPAAFRTWVYKIAYGKSVELLRKLQRLPRTGDGVLLPEAAASENDYVQLENAELVHSALSRLTIDHREVLVLHFMENMSVDDMAQVLGCPPGTVKSRMHYARLAIRLVIEELSGD